jgi:hypothetical protein
MTDPHDIGRMGQGAVPGMPVEGYLFKNWIHGVFLEIPTNASTQATGTGDGVFRYNQTAGVVTVDGTSLNVVDAADVLCETAGNIMANTYSRVYTIIAWKHPTTGVVALKTVEGTVALTAAAVRSTNAEIEAGLVLGSRWVLIGTVKMNRTGDTACTQAQDNSERPLGVPA